MYYKIKDTIKRIMACLNAIEQMQTIFPAIDSKVQALGDSIKSMNDGEKSILRIALESSRQMERKTLVAIVKILDHVCALHTAAEQYGNSRVLSQISEFAKACGECAETAGLTIICGEAGQVFDSHIHQLTDEGKTPFPGARIDSTVALGYFLNDKMIRRAVVTLQNKPVHR